MQQRQPRLGDVLDDYCPRERRLTNHVVVAMIGDTIKQTRCTTCDADHLYKHAEIPRQRKKPEESALYSQVLANASPQRIVSSQPVVEEAPVELAPPPLPAQAPAPVQHAHGTADFDALFAPAEDASDQQDEDGAPEGPAHRRLIRAQLPRHEGQVTNARQTPDFTIRQPANSQARRFGGRNRGGGAPQGGDRPGSGLSSHGGNMRGGPSRGHGRPSGGRPGNQRSGGGRNRSK